MNHYIFDMETGDPDDILTLLFLLGRTDIILKAVTVTPGSTTQVGLIKKVLEWFERDIPVGAFDCAYEKPCVSKWYVNVFGEITPSHEGLPAAQLLFELCDLDTTLITGAPLKNLGAAIRYADTQKQPFQLNTWVAQGGFAGEGVVPVHRQLEKFRGLTVCPTYNFNGDPKSAKLALSYPTIQEKYLVSKNVCHGVYYDQQLHQLVSEKTNSLAMQWIWKAMEKYLQKHPDGKKFHDPLAACCALNRRIGTWSEVEVFHEKGGWGSRLKKETNTWIITDYDHEEFLRTFLTS